MNVLHQLLDFLRHPRKRSFALNDLDLKLRNHLRFRRGFFVEAGANNGLDQSNTLFFEKYHGWKGILIEPIPDLAAQCRRNRPGCVVENCALVPFGHRGDTVEMRYCNLMSLVKGALGSEEQDAAHLRRGCEIQKLSDYEVTVPARTLTSLLDQHRVSRIDLLSLDVEGFELQVLQGLDLDRYAPAYLLIEVRNREAIDALLSSRFDAVAMLSHHDVLYRHRRPPPA